MVNRPSPTAVLTALGGPTRQEIVSFLAQGESTVSAVADHLQISLPGTLKQLQALERVGLVRRNKAGRTVAYRLEPAPLEQAEAWLRKTRLTWAGLLARLGRHLEENA